MEETEFLRDFEGIKDYRTFLVGLDKQFKSAGVLYREFKILEGMASIALKVSPSIILSQSSRELFTASYRLKLIPWLIASSEVRYALLRMRT